MPVRLLQDSGTSWASNLLLLVAVRLKAFHFQMPTEGTAYTGYAWLATALRSIHVTCLVVMSVTEGLYLNLLLHVAYVISVRERSD